MKKSRHGVLDGVGSGSPELWAEDYSGMLVNRVLEDFEDGQEPP